MECRVGLPNGPRADTEISPERHANPQNSNFTDCKARPPEQVSVRGPIGDQFLLSLFMKGMVSAPLAVLLKFKFVRVVSLIFSCRIVLSLTFAASERDNYCIVSHLMSPYSIILVTTPAPTVLPPSLIANLNCSSIATGEINSTSMFILSPGITISTPSGSLIEPVTSVVRK